MKKRLSQDMGTLVKTWMCLYNIDTHYTIIHYLEKYLYDSEHKKIMPITNDNLHPTFNWTTWYYNGKKGV